MPEVGDVVNYVTPDGHSVKALVVAVWPGEYGEGEPGLNMVFVDPDPNKTDNYGRQISREACSVPHKSKRCAPARYWE